MGFVLTETGQGYRVVVRRNLVVRIEPTGAAAPEVDPLAVSTRLAENNQANGCIDGDYELASFEEARHFAALCLGFVKNLCENALDAIADAGTGGAETWENRFLPGNSRRD